MTLGEVILRTAKSMESLSERYPSPPPEFEEEPRRKMKNKKMFKPTSAKVDSSAPTYNKLSLTGRLEGWSYRALEIARENMNLVQAIRRWQLMKGKVDSHWKKLPPPIPQYYQTRVDRLKTIQRDNQIIYKLITDAQPKIPTTESLRHDWKQNRDIIIHRAMGKFVLFPPIPQEMVEDKAFLPPSGVKRPRVYLTLRIKNCAPMGEIAIELFTDVCPKNCRLFMELANGDGLGYGYVGTCFFRKVPNLFWTGGDVVYNNGFGCYAQKERIVPIGADNYHFSHSMSGLVSMPVTADDEVCGIFNITFKPMPQFDLKNVVIGRIIRPCRLFDVMRELGSPLSTMPVIEIAASRHRDGKRWVYGQPNLNLPKDAAKLMKQNIL